MLWVSSKDQNLRKRLQRFPHLDIEIVKRSDQVSGFVSCPNAGSSSAPLRGSTAAAACPKIGSASTERPLAFLRLASIRLMLRKLCNPA
jgi:hypothetical protein